MTARSIAVVTGGALLGQWLYPFVLAQTGIAVDDNSIGVDDLVITATITASIVLVMMIAR